MCKYWRYSVFNSTSPNTKHNKYVFQLCSVLLLCFISLCYAIKIYARTFYKIVLVSVYPQASPGLRGSCRSRHDRHSGWCWSLWTERIRHNWSCDCTGCGNNLQPPHTSQGLSCTDLDRPSAKWSGVGGPVFYLLFPLPSWSQSSWR